MGLAADYLPAPDETESQRLHQSSSETLKDSCVAELEKVVSSETTSGLKPNEPLPEVILPSGSVTITESARSLFSVIAPSMQVFSRGGSVVRLIGREDGVHELEILRDSAARSYFEKFVRFFSWRSGQRSELVLKPSTVPKDIAEAYLQSEEARLCLPTISGLVNCPLIREENEKLVVVEAGYDEVTGLYVTNSQPVENVDLITALDKLTALLGDFSFQTESDKSRAIAGLLTPALKIGGFIKGPVPIDVGEADQSQSGKGYRQELVVAIYNERMSMVTKRSGGVGSIDESLDQKLIAGRPFIQFDNFRGRFDSPHLEAFMTAQGRFSCRVPYRAEITVDRHRFLVFITSNGVETTRDLANRSSIIRIKKQSKDYIFSQYSEGDVLQHVQGNQPFYLGCVFAVVREWCRKGKLRTQETRHDFREWAQTLDWIVQNIFKHAPLMDGHCEAKQRVSNPAMVFLRAVVLACERTGQLAQRLTATDILGLCETESIEISGLGGGNDDEDRAKKVIGSQMAKVFRDGDSVELEGFKVRKIEVEVPREDGKGSYRSRTYTVTRATQ